MIQLFCEGVKYYPTQHSRRLYSNTYRSPLYFWSLYKVEFFSSVIRMDTALWKGSAVWSFEAQPSQFLSFRKIGVYCKLGSISWFIWPAVFGRNSFNLTKNLGIHIMVAGLNGTDLVQVIKFSLEGVAYTPIAIVGLFGKCWHRLE